MTRTCHCGAKFYTTSFKRTHCDACSTAARDARQQSKLAQGQRDSWKQSDRGCRYVPTPEQIAQAAAAIREKWSEAEMRTRLGMNREVLPLETQVVTSRMYAE